MTTEIIDYFGSNIIIYRTVITLYLQDINRLNVPVLIYISMNGNIDKVFCMSAIFVCCNLD